MRRPDPEPVEVEVYKLVSSRPLREVSVDLAMLNILLPAPKRFSAEKALDIVPTLLSVPAAREAGGAVDAR